MERNVSSPSIQGSVVVGLENVGGTTGIGVGAFEGGLVAIGLENVGATTGIRVGAFEGGLTRETIGCCAGAFEGGNDGDVCVGGPGGALSLLLRPTTLKLTDTKIIHRKNSTTATMAIIFAKRGCSAQIPRHPFFLLEPS